MSTVCKARQHVCITIICTYYEGLKKFSYKSTYLSKSKYKCNYLYLSVLKITIPRF